MHLTALALAIVCGFNHQITDDTTRMVITFAGSDAGENIYVSNPDGTFKSTTVLRIGTTTIKSSISGSMEGKRLAKYHCEQETPAGSSTIDFDHGSIKVTQGKTSKDFKLDVKDAPYFGNLHPQFTASVLMKVDFSKKESQEFKCFCPDAAAFLSPKMTPEKERVTPAGVVHLYDMQLAPVAAEYGLDTKGHVVVMDVPGQKLRFIIPGWESIYKDPLASFPELSQPKFKVKTDKGIKMLTRDGVTLVSDVVRPDAPGKFPAILSRTPYGRSAASAEGAFYASRGYVFVAQDCRGRSGSGGKWDPFVNERKDGFDSVQWTSTQPWCDGNVGMIGASYGGFVQWAAAAERPSALKCIIPQVSPPDAFRNLPYENGCFFLWGAIWWSKIVAGQDADMSSFMSALPDPKGFKVLPLSKVDKAVLGRTIGFYQQWLKRDKASDWTGFNYQDDLKNVTIPALSISGWWDGDEIGTMTNWQIMRALGRKNQWLIYGPWTHLFNSTTKVAGEDFGATAVIDLDSVYLRWFDTWLKHKQVHLDKVSHVRAFITGSNKWMESNEWPFTHSKQKTLYLAAKGSAFGPQSSGQLLATKPHTQAPTKYTFDPHISTIDPKISDPDPNHASFVFKLDPKDKTITVFKSDPMVRNTTVTGPCTLDLKFSTSARDTDFFASLVDVDDKGQMRAMGQAGKIRCSYINGLSQPRPLKPGKIYSAKLQIWDFAHQLKKGHRLGLIINSSMFPVFARNLGTAEPIATATAMVIQNQSLYHDAKNSSALTFQVIE